MGHRIAKQVGEQLRDAPAVTVDRPESSTLSISADVRATLLCINPRISLAASFWSAFVSILAPAAIEASGLRRSWPSTAMNCSRSSEVSHSLNSLASVTASRSAALHGSYVRAGVGLHDEHLGVSHQNASAGSTACREISNAGTKTKSGT
jgi:hypothetical protein